MPTKPPPRRKRLARAARPKARRARVASHEPPRLSEPEREYAGLRIFLADDVGFRLATATFDRPATRDGLMERLRADLISQGVYLSTLDLQQKPEEDALLRLLEEHLATEPTPLSQRRAVALVNVETRLTYSDIPVTGGLSGARDLSFLELANFHRDAFPKTCPHPVVLWLTEPAETAFARNAPDFWHWRSVRFDFEREGVDLADFRAHPTERLEWFRHIAAASRRLGDKRGELYDLIEQGIAEAELGKYHDAIREWEAALELTHELGDRGNEGIVLGNLGGAYYYLGELQKAISYFEQSLAIARQIGSRYAQVSVLDNLGEAYRELGELHKAIIYHQAALNIARKAGHRRGEGYALGSLGIAYHVLGRAQQAITYYQQQLGIAREIGHRRDEGAALYNLARGKWDLGERAEAIAWIEQARRLYRETSNPLEPEVQSTLDRWRSEIADEETKG